MIKNPKYLYGPNTLTVPVNLNFGEYILKQMCQYSDRTAITNGLTGESYTNEEILQTSLNAAISLRGMGVKKGETVALCSENRMEFWSSTLAAVSTGAIVTTINVGYTKGEFKHTMSISKPKYIFVSPLGYRLHHKTLKSLDYVKHIIIYGDEQQKDAILYKELVTPSVRNKWGLVADVKYEDFQAADVDGQTDVLFILYSSGTTGLPKGAMVTHLNGLACVRQADPDMVDPSQTTLTITPWFHTFGLMHTLISFSVGKSLIFLPKFEVDLYMATIEKYKVAHLVVVPPVLVAVCKHETKYDVSSVLLALSGAAPLTAEMVSSAKTTFPNLFGVLQGYGMTESTLTITRDPPEAPKIGSVGKVVAGAIVKVVDPETRKPLGKNQSGELCLKGPSMMKGYVGKDRNDDFDEEGFFRTGDLGYYDDEGYFFIVDRLKELIKYKAFQVAPAEIESVLLEHKGIRDAGVIGISHPSAGEVPLAFVVLQPGVTLSETEVKEHVAERLSNPKHLRGGVKFIEEIPKNPSGKIMRRVLKKMAASGKSKL